MFECEMPIVKSLALSKRVGASLLFVSVLGGALVLPGVYAAASGGWMDGLWWRIYCTTIMLFLAVIFWLAPFLLGLYFLVNKGSVTIDGASVSYHLSRSLMGPSRWSEPLNSYRGVLYAKESTHSHGTDTVVDEFRIELHHDDPEKCIILEEGDDYVRGMRKRWEQFAELLSLPALRQTAEGLEVRQVGELDSSVAEQVSAGTVSYESDEANIPYDVSVTMSKDALALGFACPSFTFGRAVYSLSAAVAFILIGSFVKGCSVFIAFGVLGIVGSLCALLHSRYASYELMVSPRYVRLAKVWPWNPEKHLKYIAAEEIEEVYIVAKTVNGKMQGGPELHIEGDSGEIVAGKGVSPETLEWIKACILEVLAADRENAE